MTIDKESDFEGVNYYVVIHAQVLHDNRLTPLARLIYGEIAALANINGYAWISNGKLAEKYKVSIKTISVSISSLQELGYIESKLTYKENSKEVEQRNIYISPINKNVNTPFTKNSIPPLQKGNEGMEEKVKENNTFNNTINKSSSLLEILSFYEANFGTISGYIRERISDWSELHSYEMVIKAMSIAVDSGNRNLKYVDGILKNWEHGNIKSLSDLKNHEGLRNKKIEKKNKGYDEELGF
ncbi:DnaD domain protein [Lactococcus protaetiae]|uniref:DnaD domain protein n=1 Tax=Lactococcus protaetiae TaxID=2592653 RepID=A0A514ZA90_9LACT|nr:DnaD domain protein [Lactococcus protaetiae]QDK71485.1 DnaD domain protein [Lactococcus protaetiae]